MRWKQIEPQVHAHMVVGRSDGIAHGGHLVMEMSGSEVRFLRWRVDKAKSISTPRLSADSHANSTGPDHAERDS